MASPSSSPEALEDKDDDGDYDDNEDEDAISSGDDKMTV